MIKQAQAILALPFPSISLAKLESFCKPVPCECEDDDLQNKASNQQQQQQQQSKYS